MSEYAQIRYEEIGRVARLTLNRPRYLNAQSRILREEMEHAFRRAVDSDEIRVVVLAGEGDHFSSGHDVGTPEERADQAARPYPPGTPGAFARAWELNIDNSLRWRDLPKPTIASVQGYCIFGGWIIASAMDLIVAADDARFLPGPVQYFTVPWDLGVRKAKEVLFQSKVLTAQEALELGFVNQVVPRSDLEAATMALANRIAESDPFVLQMLKRSINMTQDAMGFRAAVDASFSNYLHLALSGKLALAEGGGRRVGMVDEALKRTGGADG